MDGDAAQSLIPKELHREMGICVTIARVQPSAMFGT